jgi:hypothetical protein
VSFSAFIAQYYEERLHAYERLDLARCAEAELLDIAGEASALHKFLTDLLARIIHQAEKSTKESTFDVRVSLSTTTSQAHHEPQSSP